MGERWTLLIIRELLTGPKRFGDLGESLVGIGTNLLSARLKHLEQEKLAQRTVLPPPARTSAYELTEAGVSLAPVVMALAQWGMGWALGERKADDAVRPAWAVIALQALFRPEVAEGIDATYEYRIGDEVFHASVVDGAITSRSGSAPRPDVVIEADEDTFLAVVVGQRCLDHAVRDGLVSVHGDRVALRALRKLFAWRESPT